MPLILLLCLVALSGWPLGNSIATPPSAFLEAVAALGDPAAMECSVADGEHDPAACSLESLEDGSSEARDGPTGEGEAVAPSLPPPAGGPAYASVPAQGPELDLLLEELGAEVSPGEIRLHLPSDAAFAVNRHVLGPEAGPFLEKAARVIRGLPGRPVLVEGFTDFTGGQDHNRELSVKRAESVRRWLQEREGLTETSFVVKGWGKSRPRASNRTEEGRRLNRRVEIVIRMDP